MKREMTKREMMMKRLKVGGFEETRMKVCCLDHVSHCGEVGQASNVQWTTRLGFGVTASYSELISLIVLRTQSF